YYLAKPSSCGPVVPTLQAKLVDDDGTDLAPGPDVVGQLCVRGPVVIKGYLNRPEATADAIRDGWFNTGDIAPIDDHGDVAEAAVFGIPDERLGEAVAAVVVLNAGSTLTEQELQEFLAGKI